MSSLPVKTVLATVLLALPSAAQTVAGGDPKPVAPAASPQITAPAVPSPPSARGGVASPAGLAGYQGLRVADIRFRTGVPADEERLRELVTQKIGEPLDKLKLRRSLQALYQTGRFQDIQVEAERSSPQEVSLVFVALSLIHI